MKSQVKKEISLKMIICHVASNGGIKYIYSKISGFFIVEGGGVEI